MKTRLSSRLVAALAIIGLMASIAVSSPSASAAKIKKHRTTSSFYFSIVHHESAFGTVGSPYAKCVKGRTVKLFQVRKHKPNRLLGVDRKTGKPAGKGKGYWWIRTNLKGDKKYYAIVVEKRYRDHGKQHLCKAYRTSVATFLEA
jgi:hypothetical protein